MSVQEQTPAPAQQSARKGPLIVAGIAIAALVAASIWFFVLRQAPAEASKALSPANAVAEIAPGERGSQVELSGTTLTGEPISRAQFQGSPVVLNIWGSWCAPCREEAPALAALSSQFAGRAQFLGINVKDNTPAALAFERNYGITYPSFNDSSGTAQLSLSRWVPPQAIPSTIVLDSQGRVAARIIGKVREATLRALIETVAAESPAQ